MVLTGFRSLKVENVLIEDLGQKLMDAQKGVSCKLSLLWFADQIKKIEAHRESEMTTEFVAWMKNLDGLRMAPKERS
jgi:hypothetical protein